KCRRRERHRFAQSCAKGREYGLRIRSSRHDDELRSRRCGMLRKRNEDLVLLTAWHAPARRLRDDTDDGQVAAEQIVASNNLANGLFTGPETRSNAFRDYRNFDGAGIICGGERATGTDTLLHHVEV